jgi:N-formylmaleamate deformylase
VSNWLINDVQVAGIKIHYYRTGGPHPPLILLHGFSDNGLCWTRVARALEGEYDLIMPDAGGHGLSARLAEAVPSDQSLDLVGLIQALNLDKPAVLGHSMGASTAALAVAKNPGLVGALVLEDPPWFDQRPTPDKSDGPHHLEQWIRNLWAKSYDEIMATGRAANPTWSEDELDPWAESKLQVDRDLFDKIQFKPSPWPEVARHITCPTLLVTGDPELGAIVTPQLAQRAARTWPHGQVVRISGAGHSIHREQYDAYIETVTNFLRKNNYSGHSRWD